MIAGNGAAAEEEEEAELLTIGHVIECDTRRSAKADNVSVHCMSDVCLFSLGFSLLPL